MNLSKPPVNCDETRVERVAQAVLEDEFLEAARAYADALVSNMRDQDMLRSLRPLMAKRERFLNLYLMTIAK